MTFIDYSTRLTSNDWRRIYEHSHLPSMYWSSSIRQVQSGPHLEGIVDFWRRAPEHFAQGRNLFLYGSFGCGKTSIAAVLAKRALQFGQTVFWTRMSDLISFEIESVPFDGETTCSDRAAVVDLLVIDEVIVREQTKFKEAYLEEFVRSRVDDRKSVILTSNESPEKMGRLMAGLHSIMTARNFWMLNVVGEDMRNARTLPDLTEAEDFSPALSRRAPRSGRESEGFRGRR